MPNTSDPLAAYTIAEDLRQCVMARLEDTPEGLPNRSCVITGAIAWDDCECGQLVVAIERSFPSSDFPDPAVTPALQAPCGAPIQVIEYRISMLRCSPSGGEDAEPPTCAELDIAAKSSVYDAWAVNLGVTCCLREWKNEREANGGYKIANFQVTDQVFVGSDGLCQGSETTLSVGLVNACLPCDEES